MSAETDTQPPMLAEPHYYWGCCAVCRSCNTLDRPLKRCTRCRAIAYCSKEHQKQDWKRHKKLCNYLFTEKSIPDEYSFFSGKEGASLAEWNAFRMNAVIKCEVMLGVQLSMCEKEMFLFPRSCRQCYAVQEKMIDCDACYCITYCSQQHKEEDRDRHNGSCRHLRTARIADTYESVVSVGVVAVPSHVDRAYLGSAPDITHFVEEPMATQQEISKAELDFCFLTCQLSGPLTLLHCLDQFQPSLSSRESLVIHIAGASIVEMLGLIKWEYLIHRLPEVESLCFTFIGPNVEVDEEEDEDGWLRVPNCEDCENRSRTVRYQALRMKYEDYKQSTHYQEPNIVLVQNCGFSEYSDQGDDEGCGEDWRQLDQLVSSDGLLVFTSYTRSEAHQDLARFLEQAPAGCTVRLAAQPNPMGSRRPIRDWETDGDEDVFYANQYLSVVSRDSL